MNGDIYVHKSKSFFVSSPIFDLIRERLEILVAENPEFNKHTYFLAELVVNKGRERYLNFAKCSERSVELLQNAIDDYLLTNDNDQVIRGELREISQQIRESISSSKGKRSLNIRYGIVWMLRERTRLQILDEAAELDPRVACVPLSLKAWAKFHNYAKIIDFALEDRD